MESNVVVTAEIVPLFASVVSSEPESISRKMTRYVEQGQALAENLAGIHARDQESYELLASVVLECKEFIKLTTKEVEPFRLITHGLYQKALELKRTIQESVETNLQAASNDLKAFERKQEEERQRIQRELEARQRQEEEERRLEAATAAEAVGLSEQAVQTILEAPSVTPAPVAAPTFNRIKGLGHREVWCAEVTDLWALVKAAAKNKALLPLLEANMPALNAQARSLKTALQIPGVRAVNKGV
jgi:hypothetical protein